ncbi:hypothetical protein H920_19909 [Fukomys damarensis]|uniref:Uncharacterized protein n=1 Tax=Fukomys damarensis TaxID=885580 RepID=A0A091CMP6_FUKDA|nr:hypothetical protein H920_19909 [Fukomys damarensis]
MGQKMRQEVNVHSTGGRTEGGTDLQTRGVSLQTQKLEQETKDSTNLSRKEYGRIARCLKIPSSFCPAQRIGRDNRGTFKHNFYLMLKKRKRKGKDEEKRRKEERRRKDEEEEEEEKRKKEEGERKRKKNQDRPLQK